MAANGGFQASAGYNNDRPPSSTGSGEPDVAQDPASSSFFNNEFKRCVSMTLKCLSVSVSLDFSLVSGSRVDN